MQRWILLGMVGVVVLAVVAAVMFTLGDRASASTKDDPEKAAAQWVDAVFDADKNRLSALTCAEHQQSLQDASGLLNGMADFRQALRGTGVRINPTNMTYQVVERSKDSVVVRVQGKVKLSLLLISRTEDMDVRLTFVREQNRWKYCDVQT